MVLIKMQNVAEHHR